MVDQGINIFNDCREVGVRDVLLFTVLPNDRGNGVVVGVIDAGEEMVLDLVVETSVEDGKPKTADIG